MCALRVGISKRASAFTRNSASRWLILSIEFDDQGLAQVMGLPRGHIKVLHLAPPEATSGMFIDLVQWLEPQSAGEPYPELNHVGINRVAFHVSDIDATTATLRRRGISFLSQEPQSFGPIRTIITTDPDGVFIQLLEWL